LRVQRNVVEAACGGLLFKHRDDAGRNAAMAVIGEDGYPADMASLVAFEHKAACPDDSTVNLCQCVGGRQIRRVSFLVSGNALLFYKYWPSDRHGGIQVVRLC
jgi:hypothetical protein